MRAAKVVVGLLVVFLVWLLFGGMTKGGVADDAAWQEKMVELPPWVGGDDGTLQESQQAQDHHPPPPPPPRPPPRRAKEAPKLSRPDTDAAFAASLPAAMQRLDDLRAQGLRARDAFLTKDHLEGFPEERKAPLERVCSPIPDREERQMCFQRGRRMYESLLRHYPNPLTRADALAWLEKEPKRPRKNGRVLYHLVFVDGKLVDYETLGHELEGFRSWELTLLISQLHRNQRSGGFKGLGTFEIFLESPDKCIGKNDVPYPTVTYSKHPTMCPSNTALEWNWIVQDSGWNMSDTVAAEVASRPYEDMQNTMTFRGSCYSNDMRFFIAALSSVTDRPYLDARCTDNNSKKRCAAALTTVNKKLPAAHPLKKLVTKELCIPPKMGDSVYGNRVSYDEFVKRKYILLVDGIGALFRLGPQLQSPGVVLLLKNKNYSLSFDEDMIPYVTYIPLSTDPERLVDELDEIYLWLEARPEVSKAIAKDSTRWGALHADYKSYQRDWQLYMSILSHMHKPEPKVYRKIPKKPPVDCSSYGNFISNNDFFQWDPKTRKNGMYWAGRMYAIACLLEPFDL